MSSSRAFSNELKESFSWNYQSNTAQNSANPDIGKSAKHEPVQQRGNFTVLYMSDQDRIAPGQVLEISALNGCTGIIAVGPNVACGAHITFVQEMQTIPAFRAKLTDLNITHVHIKIPDNLSDADRSSMRQIFDGYVVKEYDYPYVFLSGEWPNTADPKQLFLTLNHDGTHVVRDEARELFTGGGVLKPK